MDEEADAFEYQIIEFVQQILALQGIDDTPQFKRNRIANQAEQIEMVIAEANYLDDETVLDLLPNITPEMKDTILARKDAEYAARLEDEAESAQESEDAEQQEG
jgi:polyribonucleotide nucleotidyltransferase